MNDSHIKTTLIVIAVFVFLGPAIPLPTAAISGGHFGSIDQTISSYPLAFLFGVPIALISSIIFLLLFFTIGQISKFLKIQWNKLSLAVLGLIGGYIAGYFWLIFLAIRRYQRMSSFSHDFDFASRVLTAARTELTDEASIAMFVIPSTICGLISLLVNSKQLLRWLNTEEKP